MKLGPALVVFFVWLAWIPCAGASAPPALTPPPIVPSVTTTAAFADFYAQGPIGTPVLVHSATEFEHIFGSVAENHDAGLEIRLYFENGGQRAWVDRLDHGMRLQSRVPTLTHELDAIPDLELFVVPPLSVLSPEDATRTDAAILRYAQSRGAFLVLDPPISLVHLEGLDSTGPVIQWIHDHDSLQQSSGALYFPRLVLYDNTEMAASGAVAGRIVATDRERGVWVPPAGKTDGALVGVRNFDVTLNGASAGKLTQQGINPMELFIGIGPLIFGTRTLRGSEALNDEFKYLQVKRLHQFLEHSIVNSSGWLADQEVDGRLLNVVAAWINPFLARLEREGAFHSYSVTCNRGNNTPADAQAGRVNVQIQYAPVQPAEFIALELVLKARPEGRHSIQ